MRHFLRRRALGRAGLTLVELVITVLLMGVIGTAVAPRLQRYLDRTAAEGAAKRIVSDLYAARMLAVQSGYPVELRFRRATASCYFGDYSVVLLLPATPGGEIQKRASLELRPSDCLNIGRLPTIGFDARGFPLALHNRTVTVRRGTATATFVLSALGRLRHEDTR